MLYTRKELLRESYRKLNENQTNWEEYYDLPMEDFILILYSRCSPSVYGTHFEKKLHYDLCRMGLPSNKVKSNKDMGDLQLRYPAKTVWCEKLKMYRQTIKTHETEEMVYSLSVGSSFYKCKNIEVKFSYLGKNDHYTVRNIRPWQDIDYFLLVFVDVYNDFKLMYSLVDKWSLLNCLSVTFSAMSGTHKSNEDNVNIPLGCVVKDGSMFHREIEGTSNLTEYNLNLLGGSDSIDLVEYLTNEVIGMRKEFIDNIDGVEVGGEKLSLDIDEVYRLNPDHTIMGIPEQIKEIRKNYDEPI
jgi:hypothetical protein